MAVPDSTSSFINRLADVSAFETGDLQFPSDLNGVDPYIAFIPHRAKYNNSGAGVLSQVGEQSVALYVPPGVTISDSMQYESKSEGLVGAAIDRFQQGTLTDVSKEDIASIATERAQDLAAAAGGIGGGLLGGTGGGVIGAVAGGGAVDSLQAIGQRSRGRVLNPREFMLFKSPDMRTFNFQFRMIPKIRGESRTITEIVKFFRSAAYPALSEGGIDYVFPDAFTVRFGNLPSYIKIPEVVCTGVEVSYNPTSPSYFESETFEDNEPVETTLSISFQELKPITKGLIEQGF